MQPVWNDNQAVSPSSPEFCVSYDFGSFDLYPPPHPTESGAQRVYASNPDVRDGISWMRFLQESSLEYSSCIPFAFPFGFLPTFIPCPLCGLPFLFVPCVHPLSKSPFCLTVVQLFSLHQ